MKKNLVAISAVVALLAIGGPASATTYTLTNSNFAGTGDFGTILTALNANNTITTTVTAASGFAFFGSGAGNGMFGFNTVGSNAGLAYSALTVGVSPGTGGQFNGFGNFANSLEGPQPPNALTSFTFTVNRTGGFTADTQLAGPSSNGNIFAAHIIDTAGTGAGNTGFVTTGTPNGVPEPSALMLLGAGLAGIGIWRRKAVKV